MSDRIRFALLVLVLVAFFAARAGGAFGATEQTTAKQARVVSYAKTLVGVRYSYGGMTPRSGFDCSGFTRYVFEHFGIDLPHYSAAQFHLGKRVAKKALKPGDLVFFDGLGHVGIYVGGNRFVHAPHSGTRVRVEPMSGWYAGRYVGARRVI